MADNEKKVKMVRVRVLKGTVRAGGKEWGPDGIVEISEKAAISLRKLGRVEETGARETQGSELEAPAFLQP